MSEKNYSKRELDHFFKDTMNTIKSGIESIRNESLPRIETQVLKTNGRVTRLEKWQYTIIGGLTIITTLVLPMFFYQINKYENRITNLEQIFSEYDIIIEP